MTRKGHVILTIILKQCWRLSGVEPTDRGMNPLLASVPHTPTGYQLGKLFKTTTLDHCHDFEAHKEEIPIPVKGVTDLATSPVIENREKAIDDKKVGKSFKMLQLITTETSETIQVGEQDIRRLSSMDAQQ